jgi:hypothetical protein
MHCDNIFGGMEIFGDYHLLGDFFGFFGDFLAIF